MPPGSPGLVRAVLEHLRARPEQLAQHRAAFLSALCEKVRALPAVAVGPRLAKLVRRPLTPWWCCQVLAARERPAAEAVSAYQPLLDTATHDEFGGVLLPLILRMAKRSPDSVLPSAAEVLGLLRLDLSQYAAAVVADLQPFLRHAKQPVR